MVNINSADNMPSVQCRQIVVLPWYLIGHSCQRRHVPAFTARLVTASRGTARSSVWLSLALR